MPRRGKPGPIDILRLRAFRKACIDTGVTAAQIAKRLGIDRSAVSHVVSGRERSARVEREIIRLFPEIVRDYPFSPAHPTNVAQPTPGVEAGSSVQGDGDVDPPTEDHGSKRGGR